MVCGQSRKNRLILRGVSALCFIVICVSSNSSPAEEVFPVGSIAEGQYGGRWYTATIVNITYDPSITWSFQIGGEVDMRWNEGPKYDVLWHVDGLITRNHPATKIRKTRMSTCTLYFPDNGRLFGLHHSGVRVTGTADESITKRFNIEDGWIIKEVNGNQVPQDTSTEELKILLDRKRKEEQHLRLTFDCHQFVAGDEVEAKKMGELEWSRARITSVQNEQFKVKWANNDTGMVSREHIRRPHQEANWKVEGQKVVATRKLCVDDKCLEKGQTAEIYSVWKNGTFRLMFNEGKSQKKEYMDVTKEHESKFVPVMQVNQRVQATEDLVVWSSNMNFRQRIASGSLGAISHNEQYYYKIGITFDDYGSDTWWLKRELGMKISPQNEGNKLLKSSPRSEAAAVTESSSPSNVNTREDSSSPANKSPAARTTNPRSGTSSSAGSSGAASNYGTSDAPKSSPVTSEPDEDINKSYIYIGSGTGGGILFLMVLLWLCCRSWDKEAEKLEEVELDTPGDKDNT